MKDKKGKDQTDILNIINISIPGSKKPCESKILPMTVKQIQQLEI